MNAHTSAHTFGFGTTTDMPHDQAIAWTCAALREQGLCVLDGIDIRKTLRERFNPRFHPYLILSVCNRALAQRALQGDPDNLLWLCNVVVYDNGDGTSAVETLNPPATLGFLCDDGYRRIVAQEAESGLRRALDGLNRSEE